MTVRKTIVITGGTGGIGYQSAMGLAQKGHTIIVTGRNKERGETAVESIKSMTQNNDIHLFLADFSEPTNVNTLATELLNKFPKIDVLINNTGYLAQEKRINSLGVELSFAINVVAPIILTKALLPALEAASPSRVFNITGGTPWSKLDVANLDCHKTFSTMSVYNNSKRSMEAATLKQAKDLSKKGVFINILYPGAASTPMTRRMTAQSLPLLLRPLWPLFSRFMQKEDGGKSAKEASLSRWRRDHTGAHAPSRRPDAPSAPTVMAGWMWGGGKANDRPMTIFSSCLACTDGQTLSHGLLYLLPLVRLP